MDVVCHVCVQGLAVMIVPPTMLHLEALFNSSVSTVSLSILVRSSTYMVGCLLSGLLFDRVGRREIQLAVCLLLRMLLLGVCTFHTVGAYIASWGLFGIVLGYMEAGTYLPCVTVTTCIYCTVRDQAEYTSYSCQPIRIEDILLI